MNVSYECLQPNVIEKELHHQLICPGEERKNVQWFYRYLFPSCFRDLFRRTELDFSLATTYQLNDDGVLLLPVDEPYDQFSCASDYLIVPQRFLRQARPAAGQAPQFTYKPKDSSYREGTAVKIHCEVVGEPKPSISWYYKNQVEHEERMWERMYFRE